MVSLNFLVAFFFKTYTRKIICQNSENINEKLLQAGERPGTELVPYTHLLKYEHAFYWLFRVCTLVYFCLSVLCVCVVCKWPDMT